MKKKMLSLFMAAVMLITTMIPLGASAAEAPVLAALTVNGTAIWPNADKTVESTISSTATTFTLAAVLSGTGAAAGMVEAVQKDNVHKDRIAKNDATPTTLALANYSVSGSVYTIPIIVTGNGGSETYTLRLTRNNDRSTTKLADKPVVKTANGILDVSVNNTRRLINVNVAYGYNESNPGVITVTPVDGATVANPDVTVENNAQLNVTSEAGITRAFTIVVNEEPALTFFSIAGKEGVFSDEDDPADGKKETITVTLTEKDIQDKYEEVETNPAREVTFASLAGTTVTGTASGALTNGGKITMTGLGTSVNNPKDFTDTLTVSCNGVTFTYNLKVVVTPKSDCEISYAQIDTEIATIGNDYKITAVMENGYDVANVAAGSIVIRVPVGATVSGGIPWTEEGSTATYDQYRNSALVDLSVPQNIVVTSANGKNRAKYNISASNSTPDKLSTSLTAFSLMNGTTEYKGSISGDRITVTVPYMTKSLQTWKVYATPDADGKVYEANGAAPTVADAVVNGTTTVADIAAGSVLNGITNGEDVNIASFVRLLNKKNASVYHDYSLTVKFEPAKTGKTLNSLTVTASDKTTGCDVFHAMDSTNTYCASGLASNQIVIETAYSHKDLSKYVTEFTTAAGGVAFVESTGAQVDSLDQYDTTGPVAATALTDGMSIVVLPEAIAKTIGTGVTVEDNKQYGTEYTVKVQAETATPDGRLHSLSVNGTALRFSGTTISGTIPYSATVAAASDINNNSTIFPVFTISNFAKMGIDASHTFVSESEGAAATANMKFGFVRKSDGTVAVYAWDGASATVIDGTTQKLNVYAENGALSNSYTFDLKYAAPHIEASITSFRVANTDATIVDRSITVTVPYGTQLNGLIPTFTASAGATVAFGGDIITSGKTPLDFSRAVTLIVTSEDKSRINSYSVKVTASTPEFLIEDGILTKYCGSGGDVVIPDGVTSIGDEAFYGCSSLTSVTISDSVTWIGSYAFCGCSGLTNVTIPDSVTSIGNSTFYGCSSLTNITIPDSVTWIGNDAFSGCPGLTSITIPGGVTSIGYATFSGCSGLTSITIPGGVTSIGYAAFSGCTGLTSVTIPDSVTTIGGYAFSDCSGLTSITIPDSVTSIGDWAFSDCTGLTSITIPNSVTTIGDDAFSGCTSLKSIQVSEDSLNYASKDGVLFNKELTTLLRCPAGKSGDYVIPDSVTSIEWHAFSGCSGLTSVSIPNSVTSIKSCAFEGCTGLTNITISDSVTEIGCYAFSDCSGLTRVTIPDSVTSIGDSAFYACIGLTNITISDSVTEIGGYAFSDCSGLTSITIPDSVTSIGNRAFLGCTGLTEITVAENNQNYASRDGVLFNKDFTYLERYPEGKPETQYTIPDSVTGIGDDAFSGCTGLTSITIPDSVTSIGNWAFCACSNLKKAIFMGNAPTVGNRAFAYTDLAYFCIYYQDGATGWTTPTWTSSGGDTYSCKPISELPPDDPTPPVTPPIGDDTPDEPEPPTEPTVETETSPDGTVTTTTTWPDGKKAVQEKTPDGGAKVEVTSSTGETIAKVELPADPGEGKNFEDVKEGAWYEGAVDKATAYGLFNGTSETEFTPDGSMTRGMVAQVLYNLSGKTGYGAGSGNFTDVAAGKWYENAIDWAAKAEIVSGMGGGKFDPERAVTREQLVTMLYRYAQAIGADTKASMGLGSFPDSGEVTDYAETAMKWAVAEGFISGREQSDGNYIAPKGTATRAEVAAILTRFVEFLK